MENKEFGTPPWEKYLKDEKNKEEATTTEKRTESPAVTIRYENFTATFVRKGDKMILRGKFQDNHRGPVIIPDAIYKQMSQQAWERTSKMLKEKRQAEAQERGNPDNFEK